MEAELSPGDDPEAEIFLLKEKVDSIKKKLGEIKTVPIAEALPINNVEKAVNRIEDGINSCTDMTVLLTYKLLVKGKPELQGIYDKKIIELSK
jgi:hypothetical protein